VFIGLTAIGLIAVGQILLAVEIDPGRRSLPLMCGCEKGELNPGVLSIVTEARAHRRAEEIAVSDRYFADHPSVME